MFVEDWKCGNQSKRSSVFFYLEPRYQIQNGLIAASHMFHTDSLLSHSIEPGEYNKYSVSFLHLSKYSVLIN